MSVKDSHLVRRQRSQFGKPGKLERIQTQVHAACNGDIYISALERGTRRDDRQQAGGACRVHRVAGAFEIEVIADSSGDSVGEASSQRFFSRGWEGSLVKSLDFFNQLVQIAILIGTIFL